MLTEMIKNQAEVPKVEKHVKQNRTLLLLYRLSFCSHILYICGIGPASRLKNMMSLNMKPTSVKFAVDIEDFGKHYSFFLMQARILLRFSSAVVFQHLCLRTP